MRQIALSSVALLIAVFPALGQGPPKPGPEQEALKKYVGEWNVKLTASFGDMKGTASFKMGIGGMWLIQDFKGDFGGMPFEGQGVSGYDTRKKKYVSTWIDSMDTGVMTMEGNYSADGKTFTETGDGFNHEGKPAKIKSVTEFKDKDTFVFKMFTVENGKDQPMMELTYTRK